MATPSVPISSTGSDHRRRSRPRRAEPISIPVPGKPSQLRRNEWTAAAIRCSCTSCFAPSSSGCGAPGRRSRRTRAARSGSAASGASAEVMTCRRPRARHSATSFSPPRAGSIRRVVGLSAAQNDSACAGSYKRTLSLAAVAEAIRQDLVDDVGLPVDRVPQDPSRQGQLTLGPVWAKTP